MQQYEYIVIYFLLTLHPLTSHPMKYVVSIDYVFTIMILFENKLLKYIKAIYLYINKYQYTIIINILYINSDNFITIYESVKILISSKMINYVKKLYKNL